MAKLNKKDLQEYHVIDSSYCSLQNLLSSDLVVKLGYNSGVLGWNWNAFLIIGTRTVILNSYRNGSKKWRANFSEIENELEEIDRECNDLYKKTDEEKAEILKRLQELVNR